MSRPNTRNKNKRHQKEESENTTYEILRKIHLTGEITNEDIRHLYSLHSPACQSCRVNSNSNPNCFCALIPLSQSTSRKSGLWQKTQDFLLSLGPNPNLNLRANPLSPAGLTNLGATCYANSILQCLYMNTSFRAGIFALEPSLLTLNPALQELSRLFAQLHSSKLGFIDSAPFIKTLELDNGVQQDSHEFLTLFLSLLERSIGKREEREREGNNKSLVQDLFRGTVSHVTRCCKCGKDSEASSKMEDFYELELNIKDIKRLDQSLDQYLSVEELQGENQYFCDSCSERVDATRCIKLRSLPKVLNLQLKRYVFLPKTTTKKKITSSFSFPRKLEMRKRLALNDPSLEDNSESCFKYELSAILIHKGTTVNSGHYVAHIKDELTGLWWEFDDEHVSELGPHPFGEINKDKDKENNNKHKNTNNNGNSNGLESNGNHEEEEMFSSNDCYMLMYKQINNTNNNDNFSNNNKSELPSYYREEIEKLNEEYERECEEYERIKEEKLKYIIERREEVKSILAEAPVLQNETQNHTENNNEIYFWISTDWLRQWADNIQPPPLDNSGILCEHGKVPVSKVNSMKRISAMAWQLLHSKYGGGPVLSKEEYCKECLKRGADSAVSADVYREQKASFKDLAESALAGKPVEGPSYFVSRSWLVQWLRRKNSDRISDDVGPIESLTCPHGGLLPEMTPGAKRVSVPQSLWLFLYQSHFQNNINNQNNENNNINGDEVAVFPGDMGPCQLCDFEMSQVATVEDNLRVIKSKLRMNHEKLISGKSFALNIEQNYNLVPAKWLVQWRAYVTATGKNISAFSEPESLQSALHSILCNKHSLLVERPVELVCKRGIITQKVSSNEGLIIIPEANWIKLCEEWNVQESNGISCQIAFCTNTSPHESTNSNIINNNNNSKEKSKISGSSIEEPISVEENNNENNTDTIMEESNEDSDSRKPYIKTQIKVCEECIGERESCLLMQKLNYKNENISVFFVRGKEAPKSIQNGSTSDPERRVSKRSRKSNYGNSVSLTVSGSTSIYQLKMMIWEAFGVVKENQKLHKGSLEIEGDNLDTLADKNIFPGDVLWVKDSEIYENRDIADEIAEGKPDVKKTEEGFRGTLLTSDISSHIYGEN